MALLLNYLPMIATFFLSCCYVPQLIKTFRTKDVSSMSLPFWLLLNVALTCLFINALVIYVLYGTWGYVVTEFINEALAFAMLVMVFKYRKGKSN